MPMLNRKTAVLAKIETTYGTDPTPTGAANAILLRNFSMTPLAADTRDREIIRPFLGASDTLLANRHVEIEFEIEMCGSGSAGTAPAYSALLRACALSETISAGLSVTYAPVSTTFESVTIYAYKDGRMHKLTGCRGSVVASINSGDIPVFKFSMMGIYNAPTDTAMPAVTLTAFQKPLVANTQNTTPFSFFAVTTLVLQSLEFDLGNTVEFRSMIGSEYVQISDRKSVGKISYEATALSVLDPFSVANGNSTGALSITHGTVAGNKVTLAAPAVDLRNPSYDNGGTITMLNSDFVMLPSSGNDDLSIVFT